MELLCCIEKQRLSKLVCLFQEHFYVNFMFVIRHNILLPISHQVVKKNVYQILPRTYYGGIMILMTCVPAASCLRCYMSC